MMITVTLAPLWLAMKHGNGRFAAMKLHDNPGEIHAAYHLVT
jgi:hypothetical protein